MLIVERQQRLLGILQQQRSAQLDELASTLGVSASTVRRDLEALEQTGEIKRTHGGAIYVGSSNELRPASFAGPLLMQLSTSQFIGLASGLAVAAAYVVFDRGADAHPEAAMDYARRLKALSDAVFNELSSNYHAEIWDVSVAPEPQRTSQGCG